MPHKPIAAVDVIWEFRMTKLIQISTKATRANLIPTDVSKKKKKKNRFNQNQIVASA